MKFGRVRGASHQTIYAKQCIFHFFSCDLYQLVGLLLAKSWQTESLKICVPKSNFDSPKNTFCLRPIENLTKKHDQHHLFHAVDILESLE